MCGLIFGLSHSAFHYPSERCTNTPLRWPHFKHWKEPLREASNPHTVVTACSDTRHGLICEHPSNVFALARSPDSCLGQVVKASFSSYISSTQCHRRRGQEMSIANIRVWTSSQRRSKSCAECSATICPVLATQSFMCCVDLEL